MTAQVETTMAAKVEAKLLAAIDAIPWDFLDVQHHQLPRLLIVARALRDEWRDRAHLVGWTDEDLFGGDSTRPVARTDLSGLVWSLFASDCRVIEINQDFALLETRTRSLQRFVRPSSRCR
ncbi:MAG TPA: hypothetical protein VN808_19280 [Stellaceae bacterium]|nr:hypothetical protein [Stellaceae bacterium]